MNEPSAQRESQLIPSSNHRSRLGQQPIRVDAQGNGVRISLGIPQPRLEYLKGSLGVKLDPHARSPMR